MEGIVGMATRVPININSTNNIKILSLPDTSKLNKYQLIRLPFIDNIFWLLYGNTISVY